MFYGSHWPLSAALSIDRALSKVDVRSMFFATMFVIIILVLAYLTNPSETSFRTYLTEQSFRQHLSRLDDTAADDASDSEDAGVHFTLTRRRQTHSPVQKIPGAYGPIQSLHFVNRAAISLRTPKHVFYSFGVLTVAAVLPSGAGNRSAIGASNQHDANVGFMVSESWFIGAFGKWWRGGPIQSWWISSVTTTKDAERCNSGVLDMKALDSLECYEGLPFNTIITQSTNPPAIKDSPSKSRGTERSIQRSTSSTSRSTTPPPLPKSASLPLHAPRVSPSTSNKTSTQHQPTSTPIADPNKLAPPQLTTSPSAIFDQSPVISELLRQISTSKNAVHDVKAQIHDVRQAAAKSSSAIQQDLEKCRERKKSEDVARAELKARTKALEDSKRGAEAGKRDAEKRLRAAESARENAQERIIRLTREIEQLKARMEEDKEEMAKSEREKEEREKEREEEVERRRKEIRVAEEVVAALNGRAKELEEKVREAEERVKKAREQAELRRQDRAFRPLHHTGAEGPWSSKAHGHGQVDPHAQINMDGTAQIEVFPPSLQVSPTQNRTVPAQVQVDEPASTHTPSVTIPPRPRHISLGAMSSYSDPVAGEPLFNNGQLRAPSFDEELDMGLAAGRAAQPRFSPFGDSEHYGHGNENAHGNDHEHDRHLIVGGVGVGGEMAISPRSSSLIPTSLIKSLDVGVPDDADLSRSFQSESDPVLDREWRKVQVQQHPFPAVEQVFNSSPTEMDVEMRFPPGFDGVDSEDPFEVRPPPLRHRFTDDGVLGHHSSGHTHTFLPESLRNSSEPQPLTLTRSRTRESSDMEMSDKAVGGHRRWFSSGKDHHHGHHHHGNNNGTGNHGVKEKKGLNPEAKVFQFKKTFPLFGSIGSHSSNTKASPYDLTAPTHAASNLSIPSTSSLSILPPPSSDSDSIFSTLSMRAFAPSPAEREALKRALGVGAGTSGMNKSLDRLPTLSDVIGSGSGGVPPSPPSLNSTHVAPGGAVQRSPGHVHTHAIGGEQGIQSRTSSLLVPGFAWLQSLPRMGMRKSKFSPWEDEGVDESNVSGDGSVGVVGEKAVAVGAVGEKPISSGVAGASDL